MRISKNSSLAPLGFWAKTVTQTSVNVSATLRVKE
jgi:hypothetical protein